MTERGWLSDRRRNGAATLGATLVVSLLLFLGLGHGLAHESNSAHDTAAGLAGVCLVLFTLLAPLALVPARGALVLPAGAPRFVPALVAGPPPDVRARASPAWLQRFLR